MSVRGRRWCFTFYPDNPEDMPGLHPSMDYMIYGWETCPTTGRPHLQGYVEFSAPRTQSHCQGILPCSWILCDGNQQQNINYCRKEGDFVEFGEKKNQGKRTDLLAVREAITEGATTTELWENHFSNMVRYHRGIAIYQSLRIPERSWQTFFILIVGPAGRGKSHTALALAKGFSEPIFHVPETKGSGLYFDGYQGQSIVLLDEMDGGRMKPTLFNTLINSLPCTVPVHGSANVNWCPRFVIATSNYHPRYWWRGRTSAQLQQTLRRVHWIWNFCDRKVPESSISNLEPPSKKHRTQVAMVETYTLREKIARDRRIARWHATGDPKYYEEGFPI